MKKTLVLTTLLLSSVYSFGQNKVISQKRVYDKIVKAGIAHPIIVTKQAIHESANFKSNAARNKNNIFGFTTNKLMYFDSIDECIAYYKDWQDRKLKTGEGYFKFLKRIKYASDPNYKKKVNNIKLNFELE